MKYLLYAAFLYSCYWAGNKAFPPAAAVVANQVKTIIATDSTKAHPGIKVQAMLPAQPGVQEHLVSFDIKAEINKAIAGSRILLITMPAVVAGNISPAQDSIIRQLAVRSLALLNEVNR